MTPRIINFPKIGGSDRGYLSVAEGDNLPFIPLRVYWTYYTPQSVERGGHAHFKLKQVLVAVSGEITVNLLGRDWDVTYVLDDPSKGLFIPEMYWRTLTYSHDAVQLVLASNEYDTNDYTRNLEQFKVMITG